MSMADVLPKLLRRLPDLELAGKPTFRDQIVQRGHDHLPVTAAR
jgi:cytochrome P450